MISKSLIERSRSVLNDTSVLGDLTFASGKGILFDTVAYFTVAASVLSARNSVNSGYVGLNASTFGAYTGFASGSDATYLAAKNTDANYMTLQARDTGVGLVEIARMQGAADPYFACGNNGNAAKFYYSGYTDLTGDMVVADTKGILTGTAVDDYFHLDSYDTTGSARYEAMRVANNAGAGAKIGFYGATPVVQADHIADAAGDDAGTVNAILVVLENLGLVKSS